MLVSHWYVETFAAKEITTTFFENMKDDKNLSTSDSLNLSMQKFIDNNEEKSHPFYWAPFVIVGADQNINL